MSGMGNLYGVVKMGKRISGRFQHLGWSLIYVLINIIIFPYKRLESLKTRSKGYGGLVTDGLGVINACPDHSSLPPLRINNHSIDNSLSRQSLIFSNPQRLDIIPVQPTPTPYMIHHIPPQYYRDKIMNLSSIMFFRERGREIIQTLGQKWLKSDLQFMVPSTFGKPSNRVILYLILGSLNNLIKNSIEMSQENLVECRNEVAGFIKKTFEILNNPEFHKIIFWSANGKEFVIKDISKFQEIVLPKFFRHRNINSFIRQLNMYGFHKGKKDSSKCIFSHPSFAKDKESQLHEIKRKFKNSETQEQQKVGAVPVPIEPQRCVKPIPLPAVRLEVVHRPQRVAVQIFSPLIKHNKLLISTRDLINTGPCISFLKLSRIEIPSRVSLDSDREDCLSIEDEIQRNNPQSFGYQFGGISLINSINFWDEAGLI